MKQPRDTKRRQSSGRHGSLTSDLAKRIAQAQDERRVADDPSAASVTKNLSGWNRGMRLSSEFVAAILVGAGIGYLLDQWLKTGPWLMLVMLLIGFAAGVLNVIRSAASMNRAEPPPTDAMRVPDDEEDE